MLEPAGPAGRRGPGRTTRTRSGRPIWPIVLQAKGDTGRTTPGGSWPVRGPRPGPPRHPEVVNNLALVHRVDGSAAEPLSAGPGRPRRGPGARPPGHPPDQQPGPGLQQTGRPADADRSSGGWPGRQVSSAGRTRRPWRRPRRPGPGYSVAGRAEPPVPAGPAGRAGDPRAGPPGHRAQLNNLAWATARPAATPPPSHCTGARARAEPRGRPPEHPGDRRAGELLRRRPVPRRHAAPAGTGAAPWPGRRRSSEPPRGRPAGDGKPAEAEPHLLAGYAGLGRTEDPPPATATDCGRSRRGSSRCTSP